MTYTLTDLRSERDRIARQCRAHFREMDSLVRADGSRIITGFARSQMRTQYLNHLVEDSDYTVFGLLPPHTLERIKAVSDGLRTYAQQLRCEDRSHLDCGQQDRIGYIIEAAEEAADAMTLIADV